MQEVNSCSKLRASSSPYPLPLFSPSGIEIAALMNSNRNWVSEKNEIENGELLAAVSLSLSLRSLTHAKFFLLMLARAIESWSHHFGLKTSWNSETSVWRVLAALHICQTPRLKFSFAILEMKIVPTAFCLLLFLFPFWLFHPIRHKQ